VNVESPYFGHLRLREDSGEQEILLGKGTHLGGGVAIVDWRHAPVSRLFYRYRQGDAYDEEIAGREREGEILTRRTVTIRDRQLQRVDAPRGHLPARRRRSGALAPDRARVGTARGRRRRGTPRACRSARAQRAGSAATSSTARRARTSTSPTSPGLIDPEQFALITRPTAGFVVIRGAAGSGKTTVAPPSQSHTSPTTTRASTPTYARRRLLARAPRLREPRAARARRAPRAGADVPRVGARDPPPLLPMLPVERREDTPAVVQR
jgi:DNA helicase-2/ATP-dependent DNA helicase PcrA